MFYINFILNLVYVRSLTVGSFERIIMEIQHK